ncbi:MAG: hypothetical protein HYS27_12805 [Deltaproteobacteria bacterium]|nr:hypothetical protein [Deltaproteobacteria bacterium]
MPIGIKDTLPHVNKLKGTLTTEIGKLKLDPDQNVAAVQVAQTAKAVVDAYLKGAGQEGLVPPSVRREMTATALQTVARELTASAATLAATVGAAATVARAGKREVDGMVARLSQFNPTAEVWKGAHLAGADQLAEALSGLASFAAVANHGHSYHYGLSALDTAGPSPSGLGAPVLDQSASSREAQTGAKVRIRANHLPLDVLQELAATGDPIARNNLVRAHAETANGVYATLSMLASKDLPKAGAGFVEGMRKHQDPLTATAPSFSLSKNVDFTLESAGAQLSAIWHAFDNGAPGALDKALKDNPLGKQFLVAAQLGFVKNQLVGEDRYQGNYKHADELSPETLVRNLPTALAAIEGLRTANRSAAAVFSGDASSQGAISASGFDQQLLLEAGAQWAMQAKDVNVRQEIFANVCATEAAQTLGEMLSGGNATHGRNVAGKVQSVLRDIALDSAQEYTKAGGGGASASTLVGVKHGGELLKAMHDGKPPRTDAEWQQRALDIASRISLQDVADIAAKFFGRDALPKELQDGNALRAKLTELNKGDDWFVGHVAGVAYEGGAPKLTNGQPTQERLHPSREELKAAGKKPLDAGEMQDALALFFAANTGWKQQTERKDASRVDSSLRGGVFDNYANLGAGKGDSLTAIYNLLKDAWELLTKAEKLAPAATSA